MEHTNDCPFCAIAGSRAEASFVYRSPEVLAFMDLRPINPGHVLVAPVAHFALLGDLDDALSARLFAVAREVARATRSSELQCEGVNLFLADGEAAGQEVRHTHLHVVPRTRDDGFAIDAAAWDRPAPARQVLEGNAAAIRRSLGAAPAAE